MRNLHLVAALPLLLCACETSNGTDTGGGGSSGTTGTTTDTPTATAADFGHCTYTNKFSKGEECREYIGSGWTEQAVSDDCAAQNGSISEGACSYDKTLGTCVLGEPDLTIHVIAAGDDASKCSGLKMGCETFGGGTFLPDPICEGDTPVDPGATVFQPPELVCKEPVAGEPPGMSEGGKVCTWAMISGCTEPGRKFVDYASCDPVYTQRPYYPVEPPEPPAKADERMNDPTYVAELGWVKQEVEACACVCCHQKSVAPQGASVWDIDAPGNWMDTFTTYGLAFAGGVMPSWPLGAYPPEQNNGFDRDTPDERSVGLPSTDPARMKAFFEAEIAHRGESPADYEGYDPQPDFFYQQAMYQPKACDAGIGVSAEGTITWAGGPARYVYVLESGSKNPGVPPNLDLPSGTVWRLDVQPDKAAVKSGELTFGKLPAGAKQAFPADGSAPALAAGTQYYLYVLADVGVPITRCLFQY